uniref:NADPH oxidase 5 isoform X2 n=1 Tax=Myxine glutinosa TaxID=7769 RepID=UPI00358E8DD0
MQSMEGRPRSSSTQSSQGSLHSEVTSWRSRSQSTLNLNDDSLWLARVTRQFKKVADPDGEVTLSAFCEALGLKESFFAKRFFFLFDSDDNGKLSLDEILRALNLLVHGSTNDKLAFLFEVYDIDGNGQIEPAELRKVLESCLGESSISLPNDKLGTLTSALFEAADTNGDGAITLAELSEELDRHPQVLDDLTISPVSWLKPTPALSSHHPISRPLTRTYWQNNGGKIFFLAAYFAANSVMFATSYQGYQASGPWIGVARGCGLCLNFNCVFIVVLMLRRCITLLRTSRAASFIPFEQHVFFHQLVGVVIFILASVHSLCHTANFVILSMKENATYSFWDYLLSVRPGLGWVAGSASITGVVLQLLLCIMVIFSSPCVRRNGHFEVFYWTHLCYVWIWLLLVVHASHFWKWLLVPGLLFLIEKIIGLVRLRAGCTRITTFSSLPSRVTHLIIERPPRFQFRAGDYIYLNIPAIARFEWHPFTISSAPEQLDTLWLHIRSQGQWTTRLSNYVHELCTNSLTDTLRHSLGVSHAARMWPNQENISSVSLNRDSTSSWDQGNVHMTSYKIHRDSELPGSKGNAGECYLDGPYGTPTRRIFLAEHAVLIGAGIGITPFASILQSIMVSSLDEMLASGSMDHRGFQLWGSIHPQSPVILTSSGPATIHLLRAFGF